MIPPAPNTFKECLQAAASRRPDGKLPIPFQTETIFLENSALGWMCISLSGPYLYNKKSQTPYLVCNYVAVVHLYITSGYCQRHFPLTFYLPLANTIQISNTKWQGAEQLARCSWGRNYMQVTDHWVHVTFIWTIRVTFFAITRVQSL